MTSILSLLTFIKEGNASTYKTDHATVSRAMRLKEDRIIIVGAGITGLTLALSIHQFGHSLMEGKIPADEQRPISISLFEKLDEIKETGGMTTLTPNPLRVLHQLGVLHRTRTSQSRYRGPCIVDKAMFVDKIAVNSVEGHPSKIGSLSLQDPNVGGFNSSLRIWRHDLRDILEHAVLALPGVSIHYGMEVVRVERDETNTLTSIIFADQTRVQGDLIFGCDGIASTVRLTYVDPLRTPRYSGYCAIHTVYRHDKIDLDRTEFEESRSASNHLRKTNIMTLSMSKKGSVLSTYLEDGGWFAWHEAVARISDLEAIEPDRQTNCALEAKTIRILPSNSHLAQTFHSIIEAIRWTYQRDTQILGDVDHDDEFDVHYSPLHEPPDGVWSRGDVCLVGSAAHARVPSLLTGAHGGVAVGLALEDAYSLAKSLLSSRHQHHKFLHWVSTRRQRVEEVNDLAPGCGFWDGEILLDESKYDLDEGKGFAAIAKEWLLAFYLKLPLLTEITI